MSSVHDEFMRSEQQQMSLKQNSKYGKQNPFVSSIQNLYGFGILLNVHL